jgi:uncharacterized membrane protein
MDDVDPRLSRLILACTVLGAGLNLVSSIGQRGAGRTVAFFTLGIGLPAIGELLATGPLGLLRHRTRPRVAGVPIGILLGWYCAIYGSRAAAERILSVARLNEGARRRLLPITAALLGTDLDLILDPAGLDAGLWEWNSNGPYATEVEGPNGRSGVPLVNYAGWLLLHAGAVSLDGRLFGERGTAGRLPAVLLLPPYLAAAAWAIKTQRPRYLLLSLPSLAALLAALTAGPVADGK